MLLLSFYTRRRSGNKFFKAGDYRNAIAKYSEAIAADPTNHTYWSNRRCGLVKYGPSIRGRSSGLVAVLKGTFMGAVWVLVASSSLETVSPAPVRPPMTA